MTRIESSSTLLSIKTGGCPEDCGYCPQSARYKTEVEALRLMNSEEVERAARAAKEAGATRIATLSIVCEMIESVKRIGLETRVMLSAEHTGQLAPVGLDCYNHNPDTGPEDYGRMRTYEDRLETITNLHERVLRRYYWHGRKRRRADWSFAHAGLNERARLAPILRDLTIGSWR